MAAGPRSQYREAGVEPAGTVFWKPFGKLTVCRCLILLGIKVHSQAL
jgi:hypothetical protein